MTDITEQLRDAARIHVELAGQSALAATINAGADEIDRLRARVAELEAADGICFTGMIVNIDGHDYGLRPNAARIVREALRDAGRIDWIARMSKTSTVYMDNQHPWNVAGNYRFNNLRGQTFRDAIDAAMAKDGA